MATLQCFHIMSSINVQIILHLNILSKQIMFTFFIWTFSQNKSCWHFSKQIMLTFLCLITHRDQITRAGSESYAECTCQSRANTNWMSVCINAPSHGMFFTLETLCQIISWLLNGNNIISKHFGIMFNSLKEQSRS